MKTSSVAAVGVFAALAYAGSFFLLAIPNATLSILLVFYAGYFLGSINGIFVGIVSSALISLFNPYGLPLLPLLVVQMLAYVVIGACGGLFSARLPLRRSGPYIGLLALLGLLTALIYQVPVSIVDAFLFGPFWGRLGVSAAWALITIVSNVIFFIILFPILAKLKKLNILRLN